MLLKSHCDLGCWVPSSSAQSALNLGKTNLLDQRFRKFDILLLSLLRVYARVLYLFPRIVFVFALGDDISLGND